MQPAATPTLITMSLVRPMEPRRDAHEGALARCQQETCTGRSTFAEPPIVSSESTPCWNTKLRMKGDQDQKQDNFANRWLPHRGERTRRVAQPPTQACSPSAARRCPFSLLRILPHVVPDYSSAVVSSAATTSRQGRAATDCRAQSGHTIEAGELDRRNHVDLPTISPPPPLR